MPGLGYAILPESGWYWNSAESGRGFNIEVQGDGLFLAAFVYRSDGSPVWYSAGGPMASDRNWSADLYETTGGQCLGCTYRQPAATKVGVATITFTSERSATLSMLGTTLSIVRYDFTGYGTLTRDALYGEWSTTEGDPLVPVYFADRIILSTPFTATSGTQYAAGNRTGSTSRVALGTYDAALGQFAVLVDSSTSYYTFYAFNLNALNRAEGQTWTYLKTSSLSGSGLYFIAHRTKSAGRVRTGVGPGVSKAMGAGRETESAALESLMAQKAQAQDLRDATDPRLLEVARRLEAVLKGP
jgi:hypothetical protein